MQYKYSFSYFSKYHIHLIVYAILLFMIFSYIHERIATNKLDLYTKIFGVLLLILKAFDSFNLYYTENKGILIFLPLHICNISLICGGLYLITKRKMFFNILYFFSFGVIIALLLPDFKEFNTIYYPYIYYTTHTILYVIVALGFRRMGIKINKKDYIKVLVVLLILFIVAFVVNTISKSTNYMFISDYAIKELSFIKPFYLYRILVVSVYYFLTYVMYLFIKEKKGDKKDEQN